MRSTRLSLLIISLALCLSASASVGAAGADEPFFPRAGNPGIDVLEYEVLIDYASSGQVHGATTVTALATQRLSRVSLDFLGPRVVGVHSPGGGSYRRRGGKLFFTPKRPIAKGARFSLEVRYEGVPPAVTDPDGTKEGWYPTDDGVLAVGEPQGSAAWFPCNNVPGDKAKFTFVIGVPPGLKAVANGDYEGSAQLPSERRRFLWSEDRPMSTYLAVLDIGRGKIVRGTIGPRTTWTLIDPRLVKRSRPVLAALPEIVHFESGLYGPYPFETAGSIVDFAPGLGYALETQSRPIYPYVPDLTTVVHETAHQWFGDSVGLKRWPEIWLNEGFATWTEWYYAERHGRRSAQAIFSRLYRVPASNTKFWNPPSARPGSAKNLFGPSVYVRGAMALEALRLKIGTKPMLRTLRAWTTAHRYGSGTIKEFIALAEEISGRNLDPFFQRWLYRRGKP